jgi:signal transduction histidine kinase
MKILLFALLAIVAGSLYAAFRFKTRVERAAQARAARKAAETEARLRARQRAEADYVLERLRGQADSDPARAARLRELADVVSQTTAAVPEPFPVSGPCAEVIDEFRAEAGERDLLYSESGDGRWLQVSGDRRLLRWAVRELFANTARHAGEWSRIAILAEPVEGAILLTVRDDGSGLDSAATARLYSPFTPRSGSGGPGVGLYAVRRIVESFGGSVEARSASGEGLVHRLRIPHPASGPYAAAVRSAGSARAEATGPHSQ